MELVLLGPPGSGKGSQAKLLAERFLIPHISTGEIFRKNLGEGTELGLMAQRYMDQGVLVPDDVTEAMVRQRLTESDAQNGFILDGFPRNLAQGEHFESMLAELGRSLTAVIYLVVGRKTLIDRLTGRRVCPQCGAVYHLILDPPKRPGMCDVCGSALEQRRDDTEETVIKRLEVYDQETAPLVAFYRRRGLVQEFDGDAPVEVVTRNIVQGLEGARD